MSLTPKTIQIFLPGGDPRGIRVAEVTTRIVQVLEVPRSLLGEFLKMPESGQVAVYFLFGESEDGAESKVYVGQTSDLRARLGTHNKEKGKSVIFDKDHLFSSASMAAQALLGRTANGWLEWKTKGGKTLDAVKRQGAE
jgi:hypothetical protein